MKKQTPKILKDERPTSNIEHRTPNNDVAPLLKLFQHRMKKQTPKILKDERPTSNIEHLFLFLFSRFDARNENLN